MYGSMTGRNKQEIENELGEEKCRILRRYHNVAAPPLGKDNTLHPIHDPKYYFLPPDALPDTEDLVACMERALPSWYDEICPALYQGNKVLISAHGNSLRALIMHLENLSGEEIADIDVPNAIPILYTLDGDMKPIKKELLAL